VPSGAAGAVTSLLGVDGCSGFRLPGAAELDARGACDVDESHGHVGPQMRGAMSFRGRVLARLSDESTELFRGTTKRFRVDRGLPGPDACRRTLAFHRHLVILCQILLDRFDDAIETSRGLGVHQPIGGCLVDGGREAPYAFGRRRRAGQ
jgi:hypothetical protein